MGPCRLVLLTGCSGGAYELLLRFGFGGVIVHVGSIGDQVSFYTTVDVDELVLITAYQ